MYQDLQSPIVSLMLMLSSERQIQDDIWARLGETDMLELYELCQEHELDGVVASRLLAEGKALPDAWYRAYREQTERLLFFKEKAQEVCAILAEKNIQMIILKNGGIMQDIIQSPAACPMEDIDSLVRKEDFLRTHEILLNNGFRFKFRSEFEFEQLEQAFIDGSTEYYICDPNGGKMWFELAWRAIAGRWIRPDKEPSTNLLFERSYCSTGTKVGILAPEDNLLQVCVHTAKHSYVRAPGLRLHLDVERIVSHKEIDWDVFLKSVYEAHVKTATYYSLMIPKKIFGTPIPEYVLDALRPHKYKDLLICRQLKKAGLLHPNGKKFTKVDFLLFQSALYDTFADLFRVIYPSWRWYKEKYRIHSPILLPFYVFVRVADLLGVRKKK